MGWRHEKRKRKRTAKNLVAKMTAEPGIRVREEARACSREKGVEMQESTRGNSTRDKAAGVVVLIDADVQERLAINDAHYKLRHIVEEVEGDMDKSLPMLCEQLKTRQTKEEMKSSIRALLRIVCSRILGDLNEFTSMCEEHIPNPVENGMMELPRQTGMRTWLDMITTEGKGYTSSSSTSSRAPPVSTCWEGL